MVSGDVGGWSSNDTWSGTATSSYTHSGCPNSVSITWGVEQSGCGSEETEQCCYDGTNGWRYLSTSGAPSTFIKEYYWNGTNTVTGASCEVASCTCTGYDCACALWDGIPDCVDV